jgi:hypothetical protein
MLYKAACVVRANAKAILWKILASGEAEGKAKVMFVKNMVCVGNWCCCLLLLWLQSKYKQIVGLMEEEGWVPGVDWINNNTESAVEWKEPNGVGEESAVELSEDEADEAGSPRKFLLFLFGMQFLILV